MLSEAALIMRMHQHQSWRGMPLAEGTRLSPMTDQNADQQGRIL